MSFSCQLREGALLHPFNFDTYVDRIERSIAHSLDKSAGAGADFRWYISLQLDRPAPNDARTLGEVDDGSSYSSMKAVSFQRSELYASHSHFTQFERQHQNIHQTAKPAIYLAWLNAVQPHSLSGYPEEQIIPREYIKNAPFTTQAIHLNSVNNTYDLSDTSQAPERNDLFEDTDDALPTDHNVDFLFDAATKGLSQ